jgi:hypothetical protein
MNTENVRNLNIDRTKLPQGIQGILNNTEKHLHNMFLAGAIIAALSCFARADYNLPMFAFLYIMWDQDDVSSLSVFANGNRFSVERQEEVDYADYLGTPWRHPLAHVLGASLVVARDGKVAIRPAQLCDSVRSCVARPQGDHCPNPCLRQLRGPHEQSRKSMIHLLHFY